MKYKIILWSIIMILLLSFSACDSSSSESTQYHGWAVSIYGNTALSTSVSQDNAGGKLSIYEFNKNSIWEKKDEIDLYKILPKYRSGISLTHNDQFAFIGTDGMKKTSGAVIVLKKENDSWKYQSGLFSPDKESDDLFGYGVAQDEQYVYIGAPGSQGYKGAVYIYPVNFLNDKSCRKIVFTDKSTNEFVQFGYSVSVDNKKLLAGAPYRESDKEPDRRGAAYLYREINGNWKETVKFHDLVGNEGEFLDFGNITAISGKQVLVGSFDKVYMFNENKNDQWKLESILTPSDGGRDYNLLSAALSNDLAILSYHITDMQNNSSYAIYTYKKINNKWKEVYKIKPEDLNSLDIMLGYAVDIDNDKIIVSAIGDEPYSPDSRNKEKKQIGQIYILKITPYGWKKEYSSE